MSKSKLALVLLAVLLPMRIFAQNLNADDGYSGRLSGEGLYQSGNTTKFFVQSRGEIKREREDLEIILTAGISYGESKGVKDDNSLTSGLTIDFWHKKALSPFLLQIIEYNFAKGIDIRSQSGGGVKYTFIEDPLRISSVSLALIYDLTDLADKPGNYKSEKLRLSLRLRSRQNLLDSNLIFGFTFLYQPSIKDIAAANIRFDSILDIPLSKHLFLRAAYLYSFEDVVSVGRKRVDNKLTFGFGIGFE
jgi:hypothetical protein